jgi:hypothetical protein
VPSRIRAERYLNTPQPAAAEVMPKQRLRGQSRLALFLEE